MPAYIRQRRRAEYGTGIQLDSGIFSNIDRKTYYMLEARKLGLLKQRGRGAFRAKRNALLNFQELSAKDTLHGIHNIPRAGEYGVAGPDIASPVIGHGGGSIGVLEVVTDFL